MPLVTLREMSEPRKRKGEPSKAFLFGFIWALSFRGLFLEGQEGQGEVKQLGGGQPKGVLRSWASSPSFWLVLVPRPSGLNLLNLDLHGLAMLLPCKYCLPATMLRNL